jgi:signal transduction histidine kinase
VTRLSGYHAPVNNLQEELDTVVRLIAHDLRNPLTAMQLNAQLIERAASTEGREKEQRWAGFIASAARRMDAMIQLLVEAERIRSGRLPLAREQVAVAPWLDEWLASGTVGVDRARVQIAGPDQTLAFEVDSRRLRQVLTTLVGLLVVGGDTAPVSVGAVRDGLTLRLWIRVPRAGAAVAEQESHSTAGHEIEMHHVRAVIETHGGTVAFITEADSLGFDVALPAV